MLSKDYLVDFTFLHGARLYFLLTDLEWNVKVKCSAQELVHCLVRVILRMFEII